jgi:protein ImuB
LELKSGITSVRLRFEPSDLIASQQTLFGAGLKNRHHYEETLKRLRQIAGSDRVGSPRLKDTHRPDQFELVPLSAEIDELTQQDVLVVEEEGLPYTSDGVTTIGAVALGVTTLGPPMIGPTFRRYARRVVAEVQFRDDAPTRLDSSRVKGIVTTAYGPWKNGGEWWHEGKSWSRIEWDLELMQQGLFRLVGTEGAWIVEGYYD